MKMKKNLLSVFLFLIVEFAIGQVSNTNIKAFTHPINNKQKVSIYYSPGKYFKELSSDIEAGWIIEVKQKKVNYFQIDIKDLSLSNVWIHTGDVGVVVQNYDSIALPIYTAPNINAEVSKYVYNTCIGLLYDYTDDFFLLQLIINDKCFFGWVERKYLCSNPYTTCG
jgi:hypothetical protein